MYKPIRNKMKGYKFYLEYSTNKDKRLGTRKELCNHCNSVVAISWNDYRITNDGIMYDGIAGITLAINPYVCSTRVHSDYLKERCKLISEKQARLIHPNLFAMLD